ncbi:MAG: hypothetical protein WCL39_01680 [Armatimonadota bacterium]
MKKLMTICSVVGIILTSGAMASATIVTFTAAPFSGSYGDFYHQTYYEGGFTFYGGVNSQWRTNSPDADGGAKELGGAGNWSYEISATAGGKFDFTSFLAYNQNANGTNRFTIVKDPGLATQSLFTYDLAGNSSATVTPNITGATTISMRGASGGVLLGTDNLVLSASSSSPVPEPAFFQMGMLIGMSGLGCLKSRRKA